MTNNTEKPLYSHHIFLFPFRWEFLDPPVSPDIAERFDIKKFDKYLGITTNDSKYSDSQEGKWIWKPYHLSDHLTYNEFNYFYDYVREVMYDLGEDLVSKKSGSENILRHYEYGLPKFKNEAKKSYYTIACKAGTFRLEIEDIILNVYNTGIGILSFHLANHDYEKPDDILAINQFGRRIYPPFLKNFTKDQISPRTDELPFYVNIELPLEGGESYFNENFLRYSDSKYFRYSNFQLPFFIEALFPTNTFTVLEKEKAQNVGAKIQMIPALDDRMFIISWYGSDNLVKYKAGENSIYLNAIHSNLDAYNYETDEWWYKFIFVDGGSMTCQNDGMKKSLLNEHTYARWVNLGTLYGASRYSFVALTSEYQTLKNNNADFLYHHMTTIYYKLVELCLVQRASIIRFSDEITHLTNFAKGDKDGKLVTQVSDLYKHYIQFVNKINFREVTAQEQGIELYDLMREQMKLERDVKDLGAEFEELNNYVSLIQERHRNDRLELLTVIGSTFLPPSLVLAVYGVSILGELPYSCLNWVLPVLSILLLVVGIFSWQAFKKRTKRWYWIFFISLFIALLSPLIIIQFSSCHEKSPASEVEMPAIKEKMNQIELHLDKLNPPIPVIIDTTKNEINEK